MLALYLYQQVQVNAETTDDKTKVLMPFNMNENILREIKSTDLKEVAVSSRLLC